MLFNILQASEELSFSIFRMAAKGGWLMIVLLILSIIAIYIFGSTRPDRSTRTS